MALKVIEGKYGSFDKDLSKRVEDFFVGENLLQSILHSHLLIEKALLHKIEEKLLRPDVLTSGKFSGLTFAQKVTVYVGLYNPSEETETFLLAMNKMRNAIAHTIIDSDEPIKKYLKPILLSRWKESNSQTQPPTDPKGILSIIFMILMFDLGAINGLQRDDI